MNYCCATTGCLVLWRTNIKTHISGPTQYGVCTYWDRVSHRGEEGTDATCWIVSAPTAAAHTDPLYTPYNCRSGAETKALEFTHISRLEWRVAGRCAGHIIWTRRFSTMKYTSIIMSDAISTKHRHITKFSKDGGAEGMRGRRERKKRIEIIRPFL